MSEEFRHRVKVAEEKLRVAMLDSDVEVLGELLSDDLIFTSHVGQVFGKEDDLGAHRSGMVKIGKLEVLDERILVCGEVGVVSVKVHLLGSYGGVEHEGDFRYTRVWGVSSEGGLQVIAGHASEVVG